MFDLVSFFLKVQIILYLHRNNRVIAIWGREKIEKNRIGWKQSSIMRHFFRLIRAEMKKRCCWLAPFIRERGGLFPLPFLICVFSSFKSVFFFFSHTYCHLLLIWMHPNTHTHTYIHTHTGGPRYSRTRKWWKNRK